MRSITKLELQYAHRFYGFKGEAQDLHGHTRRFGPWKWRILLNLA